MTYNYDSTIYYSEAELDELRKDYAERKHKGVIIAFFFALSIIFILPLMLSGINEAISEGVLIADFAGFLYLLMRLETHKCPICKKGLGRVNCNTRFCPNCGQRYRD